MFSVTAYLFPQFQLRIIPKDIVAWAAALTSFYTPSLKEFASPSELLSGGSTTMANRSLQPSVVFLWLLGCLILEDLLSRWEGKLCLQSSPEWRSEPFQSTDFKAELACSVCPRSRRDLHLSASLLISLGRSLVFYETNTFRCKSRLFDSKTSQTGFWLSCVFSLDLRRRWWHHYFCSKKNPKGCTRGVLCLHLISCVWSRPRCWK